MTAEPAPEETVWWTGLRWVDAAHMQLRRFEDVFGELMHALADAEERRTLNDEHFEGGRDWRAFYDKDRAPYDPHRPLRVPSFSLHMQVANELDLLRVAVRNVLRAQARIPEDRRPSMGQQDLLELLRNVSEHWDEVGGSSARKLAENHPDVTADGIAYTNKEIWIGGHTGVPISRITAWLIRVKHALVACLNDAGVEFPEDLSSSRFEGDDDLPWPAERLRYHWSIPQLGEQGWPREKAPEGVAEAFSRWFAARRARDHTD